MAENTSIELAAHSWSPWIGCSKVHTGCQNCYAAAQAGRFGVNWGPDGTRRKTSKAYWKIPRKWNREAVPIESLGEISDTDRPRVFPSLCDPFEDWDGPILASGRNDIILGRDYRASSGDRLTMSDLRRDFFRLIDKTPNLDWLLLTKRPENIREMWPGVVCAPDELGGDTVTMTAHRKNVWLLYSASDQETLEAGLPHLLACRDLVQVLGLSLEPLTGPIDLDECWPGGMPCPGDGPYAPGIDLVIIAGESGPNARPCNIEWIRSIVEQCQAAGVPCFVKQIGSNPYSLRRGDWNQSISRLGSLLAPGQVEEYLPCPLNDLKGGDMSEWPEDLRVREFPNE